MSKLFLPFFFQFVGGGTFPFRNREQGELRDNVKRDMVLLAVKSLNITPEMMEEGEKRVRKESTTVRVIPTRETIEEAKKRAIIYGTQIGR